MTDPTRKEVAAICKRVELVNRDVKILGANCQKKVSRVYNFFDFIQNYKRFGFRKNKKI